MSINPAVSRRALLKAGAATSVLLVIPFALPTPAKAQAAPAPPARNPNSFLRIGTDGIVTCILPTCEMGQGTHTGQAQILAEELGADWRRIRIEMPLQPSPDYRLPFGQMRSVGSFGIRFWHDPMRRAAAQARTMLIQAASAKLDVPVAELRAEDGTVVHAASGRRVAFGALVEAASKLPIPADITLRPATERTLTGKPIPRIDTPDKVRGTARFAIDVKLPDMLHGAVRLAPVYAADVANFNDASARAMPGVVAVVRVPRGAVVIARTWWEAKRAADALDITFTNTPHDNLSTKEIETRLRAGLDATGVPMTVNRGDVPSAFAGAARVAEARYAVPLLAHVCMEPITCTAQASGERTELWIGTQGHDTVRMTLERALQVPAAQLFINTTYLGGGFGRKTHGEVAVQAVLASRAAGGRPVKVMWAREDDIQQGQYRQTMMARFRAALDANGRIVAMHMRVAGPQMGRAYGINPDTYSPGQPNNDPFSLSGLTDMRYQIPNVVLEHAVVDLPMPLCPWRSIANSFTGYFLESFIDECANEAGADPLEFRRAHLGGQTRMLAVLDRIAEMSNWTLPAPSGVYRGLAVVDSYGSPVAEVVELRMVDGRPHAERVHVAIDCGRAINPGQVEAQMQGAVIEAMGAALRVKVTIANGRAEQANFHQYPILRMGEIPEIRASVVDTGSPLGGVGEPGVPPLAPALANALALASGRRVRSLPLADHGLA